jgi:hypothetical protein
MTYFKLLCSEFWLPRIVSQLIILFPRA